MLEYPSMIQMKVKKQGGKSHVGQSYFWPRTLLLVFPVGLGKELLDMGIVWVLSLPCFLLLEIFMVWNPVSVCCTVEKQRKRASDSGFQTNRSGEAWLGKLKICWYTLFLRPVCIPYMWKRVSLKKRKLMYYLDIHKPLTNTVV